MAIGVNLPKPAANSSGSLMQLAGMGAGAFLGGGNPAAIAAGGSIGGMASGMLNKPQPQAQAVEANALNRRQAQIAESPEIMLSQSMDALKHIQDPEQRMAVAQPLLEAQKIARNYGV